MSKSESFRIVACSPPSCSCPVLSIEEDFDGNPIALVVDDFGGTVYMSQEQFSILATKYVNKFGPHSEV